MVRHKNSILYAAFFLAAILLANCNSANKESSILLFNGAGTSPNDVEAIEDILTSSHLDFTLANSARLNELDTSQLGKFKLIIIPGGNFIDMGQSLTAHATSNVRKAVHQGLNYLGICAGGFLAGNTRNNSFNIASDTQFTFYAAEAAGVRKTAVALTNADATIIEHYWEDGPQFNGWGNVVSKYPDGTPATVQGSYGAGWVVLTGVHAEAPESWRKEFHFSTLLEASHNYAAKLIKAALEGKEMAHF